MNKNINEVKKIICTCCPMGCHMEVTVTDGVVSSVEGNTCKRGAAYAVDEITNPKRTLTSTVKTDKGIMLSVKTADAIPFGKLFTAMECLANVTVKTPVMIGDVVYHNICETGVDVVATKNVTE